MSVLTPATTGFHAPDDGAWLEKALGSLRHIGFAVVTGVLDADLVSRHARRDVPRPAGDRAGRRRGAAAAGRRARRPAQHARLRRALRQAARAARDARGRGQRAVADGDPAPAERVHPPVRRGRHGELSALVPHGLPALPQRLRGVGERHAGDRRLHRPERRHDRRARHASARGAPVGCVHGGGGDARRVPVRIDGRLRLHAVARRGAEPVGRRQAGDQPPVHPVLRQAADRLCPRARRRCRRAPATAYPAAARVVHEGRHEPRRLLPAAGEAPLPRRAGLH